MYYCKSEAQDGISCRRYSEEHLSFSLPKEHALASAKALHFADLDGENMLLHSRIGFWHDIPVSKMPLTHFFLQDDYHAFRELINASSLPSFISNIVLKREGQPSNRVIIPILDEEAHATYYLSCLDKNREKFTAFLHRSKAKIAENKNPQG